MRKLSYFAIILLGIGVLFSCKGRQPSNNGMSAVEPANKPIEKNWFIGQWHSLQNPTEVININSDYLVDYQFVQFDKKTKLYILKDGADVWSFNKGDILTGVEIPKGARFLSGLYDYDCLIPDPKDDTHILRFGDSLLDGEEIKVVCEVYERVGYTEMNNSYRPTKEDEWLFGTWSSSEGNTIEIIKPNILIFNGEYQEFWIEDKSSMFASLPRGQDAMEYHLYPQREQIVSYGEVFRKK